MSSDNIAIVFGALLLLGYGAFTALEPRLIGYGRAPRRVHQPVPDVKREDVERIVRRDFPSVPVENVLAILNQYRDTWGGPGIRLQLAMLKLADGSLERLQKSVDTAKMDFRDTLVAAERPGYLKADASPRKFSNKERQQIIDADWKQYEDWLRR